MPKTLGAQAAWGGAFGSLVVFEPLFLAERIVENLLPLADLTAWVDKEIQR